MNYADKFYKLLHFVFFSFYHSMMTSQQMREEKEQEKVSFQKTSLQKTKQVQDHKNFPKFLNLVNDLYTQKQISSDFPPELKHQQQELKKLNEKFPSDRVVFNIFRVRQKNHEDEIKKIKMLIKPEEKNFARLKDDTSKNNIESLSKKKEELSQKIKDLNLRANHGSGIDILKNIKILSQEQKRVLQKIKNLISSGMHALSFANLNGIDPQQAKAKVDIINVYLQHLIAQTKKEEEKFQILETQLNIWEEQIKENIQHKDPMIVNLYNAHKNVQKLIIEKSKTDDDKKKKDIQEEIEKKKREIQEIQIVLGITKSSYVSDEAPCVNKNEDRLVEMSYNNKKKEILLKGYEQIKANPLPLALIKDEKIYEFFVEQTKNSQNNIVSLNLITPIEHFEDNRVEKIEIQVLWADNKGECFEKTSRDFEKQDIKFKVFWKQAFHYNHELREKITGHMDSVSKPDSQKHEKKQKKLEKKLSESEQVLYKRFLNLVKPLNEEQKAKLKDNLPIIEEMQQSIIDQMTFANRIEELHKDSYICLEKILLASGRSEIKKTLEEAEKKLEDIRKMFEDQIQNNFSLFVQENKWFDNLLNFMENIFDDDVECLYPSEDLLNQIQKMTEHQKEFLQSLESMGRFCFNLSTLRMKNFINCEFAEEIILLQKIEKEKREKQQKTKFKGDEDKFKKYLKESRDFFDNKKNGNFEHNIKENLELKITFLKQKIDKMKKKEQGFVDTFNFFLPNQENNKKIEKLFNTKLSFFKELDQLLANIENEKKPIEETTLTEHHPIKYEQNFQNNTVYAECKSALYNTYIEQLDSEETKTKNYIEEVEHILGLCDALEKYTEQLKLKFRYLDLHIVHFAKY